MNKKILKYIIIFFVIVISFIAGGKYYEFKYLDKCLDMGGGMNPGNYDICVVEK